MVWCGVVVALQRLRALPGWGSAALRSSLESLRYDFQLIEAHVLLANLDVQP